LKIKIKNTESSIFLKKGCKVAKFLYIVQLGGKLYISMPKISPFIFFYSQNLVKLAYGFLPHWLHHKSGKNQKTKRKSVPLFDLMPVMVV
jgi:hypothetical protein